MRRNARLLAIAPALAVAAVAGAGIASPAFARGGGGGGGGSTNCVVTTYTMYPLLTKASTFPAEDAGTVKVKPDALLGLALGKVTPAPGWSASKEVKSGSGVEVQFSNGTIKKKFRAAGTTGYYGYLLVEVDTCS